MQRHRLVLLLAYLYIAAAVDANVASSSCKDYFNDTYREILRVSWTTTETAVRGFLLGFGGAILKDLLYSDRKSDFAETLRYARVVGLGSSSFLVGTALFMPATWRYNMMTRPFG